MHNFLGFNFSFSLRKCGILMLFFLNISSVFSQTTIPPSKVILDSIVLADTSKKSLLQKLIQPIKFRENRTLREKERVYDFLKQLTDDETLWIDSATVDAIAGDLVEMAQEISANTSTGSELSNQIQQAISLLDTKAPKSKIDSIQAQLENVLQGLMDAANKEAIASSSTIAAKLAALKAIQYSCGSPLLDTIQGVIVQDTLMISYQHCLQAKAKVFAWQSPPVGDAYQSYNFNYLTDLILHGYEIEGNGTNANSAQLNSLLKSGIINRALNSKNKVSLAVFSNSSAKTHQFLTNSAAQETLLKSLESLMSTYKLTGITIRFETLSGSDRNSFTAFVTRLRSYLSSKVDGFQLTVSVPAIRINASIAAANAYDFSSLTSKVDYFLVQTNKLNVPEATVAFSPSPLYDNPKVNRGSIEKTIGFYSNGKIPVNQLIVTVGYEGIIWKVPSFIDYPKTSSGGRLLDFSDVQSQYVQNSDPLTISGFDPEQVSPYFNIQIGDSFYQLWYEDGRSLYAKYLWVLENSLGGVAISDLGKDEGSTELWDALGAAMIEVDSVVVSEKNITPLPKEEIGFWGYLDRFQEDLEWASINDVYITNSIYGNESYCEYKLLNPILADTVLVKEPYFLKLVGKGILSLDSASSYALSRKDLILMDAGVTDNWSQVKDYDIFKNPYDNFLDDDIQCACMTNRWNIYAHGFKIVSYILFGVLLLLVSFIFFMVMRVGDDWAWRGILTTLGVVLTIFFFISSVFTLFLNGNITVFGVGSEAVAFWFLVFILLFGIFIGVIFSRIQNKRKYKKKDLP
ncbi:hypothetical protein JYB64_08690 [Algoriphagus aestuarii]|nr:hypothetical protein [Algoriphagus aestuarii]